jgi:hypothetical protein
MRAAAVTMLTAYAASDGVQLQVYPGRPRTIRPPTAFVDSINEPLIEYPGANLRRRVPQAEIVLVHGLYDSAEAAAQVDEFMDEFLDWVTDNRHAAGAGTLVSVTRTVDVPNFVPDWLPEDQQLAYYATQVTLEGLSLDAD